MFRHDEKKPDDEELFERLAHEESEEADATREAHRQLGEQLFHSVLSTYGSAPAGIAEGILDLIENPDHELAVMLAIHRQLGNHAALQIRTLLRELRGEDA